MKGLQLQGFLQLSEEGFISLLFWIRQSVADTQHNLASSGLPSDSDRSALNFLIIPRASCIPTALSHKEQLPVIPKTSLSIHWQHSSHGSYLWWQWDGIHNTQNKFWLTMNYHYRAKQWNCIEFLLNDYSNDIRSFTICFKYCKTVLNRGQQKASVFKQKCSIFGIVCTTFFFFFFYSTISVNKHTLCVLMQMRVESSPAFVKCFQGMSQNEI